ncbi:hypothetical protein BC360_05080 [Ensifer sp. LC163]|nr:hypothetical protein BC360_05080 [Ensifer sp. LC163]
MQIDHDPDEPKIDRGPGPWRWVFPILAVGWAGYLHAFTFDWTSIALGAGTGAVIMAWAIEITGNKVPESWRTKPPGSGRL